MIIQDFGAAQIQLILASDDKAQMVELTRGLLISKYRYVFAHRADKKTLLKTVARQIEVNGGRLPTVLVINYEFAAKDCWALLRLARDARKNAAIECVVTNPPADDDSQQELVGLGARLFDGDAAALLSQMTMH